MAVAPYHCATEDSFTRAQLRKQPCRIWPTVLSRCRSLATGRNCNRYGQFLERTGARSRAGGFAVVTILAGCRLASHISPEVA